MTLLKMKIVQPSFHTKLYEYWDIKFGTAENLDLCT